MPIKSNPSDNVRAEMHRYKRGQGPHIGKSGKLAKNRKQVIAIALNEAGAGKKGKRND
jgi:hypothetical protein